MDRQGKASRVRPVAGVLGIWIFAFGMTGRGPLLGQESRQENRLDRAYLDRFGHDFIRVVTAPAHWDRNDLFTLAAVSGTGLFFMAFDQDIRDWTQDRRTASSDRASSFLTYLGDGAVLVGLSAAVYAAGEISHSDGLRKTALLSLESLATASLLVWTTKIIVGRARPYTGETSHTYHPFSPKSGFWSFPSGHAAAVFSVATTIALQSRSVLVDITAYSLASLSALARIHDDKHWASDVIIGSALGVFVAKKIFDLNRAGNRKKVSLGFQAGRARQSLTLNIAF